MEGLIPLLYKAIRRRTTRRHYRSLSSAAFGSDPEVDDGFLSTRPKKLSGLPEETRILGFLTPPPPPKVGGLWKEKDVEKLRRTTSLQEFHHGGRKPPLAEDCEALRRHGSEI
ncbi:hypothetical protein HPP92_023438 [Vanilla planifolia]|uniref:Uncharacterized protein n=1 Tax=Vanilla planifolia TaxID=51239 RepID=A0A835PU32_VANPL|nr:hypothetical protein HPP92_023438 [Vanilla planifolia]